MIPEHFRTDGLISLIRDNFPELKWKRHRLIWTGAGAHGGDHAMLLLDERLIFRFPAPDMIEEFRLELTMVDELRSSIRLYVPEYTYVADDRTFGGCEAIHGIRLTPARFRRLGRKHRERMARDFAAFLNAVHGYPVARARKLGVETFGPDMTDPRPHELRRQFESARGKLSPAVQHLIDGIITGLSGRTVSHGSPVVTHGDVWHKHIFFDPRSKKLAGVIDWDVTIRDPALDIFGLWAYGEHFVDAVLSSYNHVYDGLKEHSRDRFYAVFIGCLLAGIEGIYSKSIKRYSEELVKHWVQRGLPSCYLQGKGS